MANKKRGRKAFTRALDNGIGEEVHYRDLHAAIERLQRQLGGIKQRLKDEEMSTARVNEVLKALDNCFKKTKCQINMLEGY